MILTTENGDFYQVDDGEGIYPEYTQDAPLRIYLATFPDEYPPEHVAYRLEGDPLLFDKDGNCFSPERARGFFRRKGNDLLVVGNVGRILKSGSIISADCRDCFGKEARCELIYSKIINPVDQRQ